MFFGTSTHTNGSQLYSARIIPFKGSWIEFATDINNVMYAYIDRKKKLPVTTLLRAIGFESDKQILDLFDLSEEVKVTRANLEKHIGRRLAGRVTKTYIDDLSDEDTGEVVSMERITVLVEREAEITEDNIDLILESSNKTILLHKEKTEDSLDFTLIFNTCRRTPVTPSTTPSTISIVSCVMQTLPMRPTLAKSFLTSSSPTSAMTSVK